MATHLQLPRFSKLLFGLLVFILSAPTWAQTQYYGKPRYQLLATQNNATLGIINIELFQNIAPYHVRNFDSLVSKKFFDTTAFHRVVPGFVIQGGDPNTRHGPVSTWGFGQAGQPTVKAEFSAALHERGILSAARSSNINSATSQFFICVAPASNLNGNYSVYGRVTSGMSVVDQIVNTSTVVGTQRPVNKIEMFVKFIGINDTVPQPPVLLAPKNDSTNVDTTIVQLKWARVTDGIIYHVDVARDSLFTDTVKSFNTASYSYNATQLPYGTIYYWKIKVNNGGFFTDSEVRHFRTKNRPQAPNTTGLNPSKGSAAPSVYPNPSKDKFVFRGLENAHYLLITDVEGRLISRHDVNKKELEIDLSDRPSGVYFYSIYGVSGLLLEGKLSLQH
jgi:peptidyl-prolyl cis-trans isomerase B (cyclophilin B)